MGDQLEIWDRGPVRWLAVDRYERRNVWTFAMGEQLEECLLEIEGDPSVRVLVLAGRGGCFSSGVDRSELVQGVRASPFPVERFLRFPKPTIACVDGLAFGMGCTIALGCDLRVASTRATFTLGFAGLGMTPEWGASYLLWRQVGWSRAMDLFLTDRTVEADEALRLGLVDRLEDPDEVEDRTQVLGERIAGLPDGTAEAVKGVLWASVEETSLTGARSSEMRTIFERALTRGGAVTAERE